MQTDFVPDTEPVGNPEPKNYLCWDVECGWRIYGIEDIKQAIEHQQYSGYGQPTKYFELDDERGEQHLVTLDFLTSKTDANNYIYVGYRLGSEVFTVRIDGRA